MYAYTHMHKKWSTTTNKSDTNNKMSIGKANESVKPMFPDTIEVCMFDYFKSGHYKLYKLWGDKSKSTMHKWVRN